MSKFLHLSLCFSYSRNVNFMKGFQLFPRVSQDNTSSSRDLSLIVVLGFFFRTLQPPNPTSWQPGQGDEATGSGSNSQSSSRPPSNSGVDGPTTPEGEEMTKAFIKSDISITSLLNCFRIRCLFNNVFNNISLKGEFIGGYCFIAPLLC